METGGLTQALTEAGGRSAQTIGFGDELRLGRVGTVRRVWPPRGVKVTQAVPDGRRWWYLVRVVDGRRGRLWWSWTLDMTSARVAPTVALWRPAGSDAVVWDRAPSHQTAAVRNEGVTLIGQPPVSPERNPAERVFAEVRRHSDGEVSATLSEMDAAAHAFRKELDADPARVRRIAGWQ